MLTRGACWEVLKEARDEEEKEQEQEVVTEVMMVMVVVEEQKGRREAVCASPPSSRKSGRCVRLSHSHSSLSYFLLDRLAVLVVVCRVSLIVQ